MSTQDIADYLTKQIFIERNIVTFRSLSRQFSLHVNNAKNELATYHHNAPYQSQQCSATFLVSGTVSKRSSRYKDDEDMVVDMDHTPESSQEEEGSEDSEEEGDDVPETRITLVNEKDLEDAKFAYDEIHTVHVYSLGPAPLHDAGLVCDRTDFVRSTDRTKGPEFATVVGRVVGAGIKMGASKKGKRPAPPAAGPSKPKPQASTSEPQRPAPAVAAAKPDVHVKSEPVGDKGKEKEKVKANGKINFFSKPKEATKDTKMKEKEVKKEETAVDLKKKMFFSVSKPVEVKTAVLSVKSAVKAPSPVPSVVSTKSEKEPPLRGVKRKSSVGLESKRERTPNPAAAKEGTKAGGGARTRGRIIMSDDESDEALVIRATARRKARASTSDSSAAMDSEDERQAKAIMEVDDDLVERVSRAPSTVVSSATSHTDEMDDDEDLMKEPDEDIDMADDTASIKSKPRKRKAKAVVPVGRNGLKKRKVTKTRKYLDENGYRQNEDYSDWESVDENAEPEPPAPVKAKVAKAKAKAAAAVKKEDENVELPSAPAPSPAPALAKEKVKEAATKKTTGGTTGKSKPSAKATSKAKPKQSMLNFFGPTKKISTV